MRSAAVRGRVIAAEGVARPRRDGDRRHGRAVGRRGGGRAASAALLVQRHLVGVGGPERIERHWGIDRIGGGKIVNLGSAVSSRPTSLRIPYSRENRTLQR